MITRKLGRWMSVAVAAALAVPVFALTHAASAAGTPQFPNLHTLPPRNLQLDRTDVSVDGSGSYHNVLRFSNTAWNSGSGRLELRTKIDPTTNTGPTYERVYDTAGGHTDYPVGTTYH